MKRADLYRILKILCIVLCAVFLLVACGGESGGSLTGDSSDEPGTLADNQRKCWQKDLLKVFYDALGKMSLSVYNDLTRDNILGLMVVIFSAWMAFQILRHVSSTSPESIGEFWTKVIRQATLCFACGFLASSTENILYTINTFVFPIYITLLEFSAHVLQLLDPASAAAKAILLPGADQICEPYNYSLVDSATCTIPKGANIQLTANSFPTEPLNLMGCMACAVSSRLDVGYTIAAHLFSSGGFAAACVALLLIAAFTFAKWGFALYLVDSIFRLDMMIVIMPFLILFFAFEQTRKWTVTGFKIILNSAAVMLCMAVLVSMTIIAMQQVLISPTMGMEVGTVKDYTTLGTIPLTMIFLGFVIVKASGLAVSLSESVTGGSGETRFQKKMAALVGTVAKGLLLLISFGGGKIITAMVDHSARLRALAEKAQKARAQMARIQNRLNSLAGRNKPQQKEDE